MIGIAGTRETCPRDADTATQETGEPVDRRGIILEGRIARTKT
jgi:hypothetical protein